jgi:hypothetical protein
MFVSRTSVFATVFVALGCSVANEPGDARPLTDPTDRIAAPEEMLDLGVHAYAVRDDGRVELFDEHGALLSTVMVESTDRQIYGEATYLGSQYVIQSDEWNYSLTRDGVSLAEVDVQLALEAGLSLEPPQDALPGFQMIAAGALARQLQGSPRAGIVEVGEFEVEPDPQAAFCSVPTVAAPPERRVEARVGGLVPSHTSACIAATQAVNSQCTNDYCIGCKTVLGCDAYCVFGDFICLYAVAYGLPCECPAGGGAEGGDDGGGYPGGGGSPGSGGGGGSTCNDDWACPPAKQCCHDGAVEHCMWLGCC